MARSTYLAAFLMLLPFALAASKSSVIGLSAPLLVWSNTDSDAKVSKVSYEVISNLDEVTSNLVLSATGQEKTDAEFSPFLIGADDGVVVVFLGSELDTADLRKSSSAVTSLKEMLDAASSSVVFPYATSKNSIKDTVAKSLSASSVNFQTVNCDADATEDGLKAALKSALKEKPRVLLVCPAPVSALVEGTEEALKAEIRQLAVTQKQLRGVQHVVVYSAAAEPRAQLFTAESRRRSLLSDLSGFGNYTACGTLCQVQVRWLEGLLSVLFLAIAACSGLVCLYMLDTPSRFQVSKESN